MLFQTLKALVGSATFHGVMTGCLRCQRAHITEREKEKGKQKGGKRDLGRTWYRAHWQKLATKSENCKSFLEMALRETDTERQNRNRTFRKTLLKKVPDRHRNLIYLYAL